MPIPERRFQRQSEKCSCTVSIGTDAPSIPAGDSASTETQIPSIGAGDLSGPFALQIPCLA